MARHLPLLAALLMTASGCVIHTHGTTTVRTEAYAAPTYVTVSSPPPARHSPPTYAGRSRDPDSSAAISVSSDSRSGVPGA